MRLSLTHWMLWNLKSAHSLQKVADPATQRQSVFEKCALETQQFHDDSAKPSRAVQAHAQCWGRQLTNSTPCNRMVVAQLEILNSFWWGTGKFLHRGVHRPTQAIDQGFPTWDTCTLRGTFACLKWYIYGLYRTEIYSYISFISKNVYISVNIFLKAVMCLFFNISVINHDKIFCHEKF